LSLEGPDAAAQPAAAGEGDERRGAGEQALGELLAIERRERVSLGGLNDRLTRQVQKRLVILGCEWGNHGPLPFTPPGGGSCD